MKAQLRSELYKLRSTWTVASVVAAMLGLVTLAVAGLRAIQAETGDRLTGGWSWVPYAGVLLAVILIAAFSASRIGKKGR